MKTIYILAFISFSACSLFGQLSDKVWLGGYNEYPGLQGYGNFELRFSNSDKEIHQLPLAFNFESTSAVASNSAGEILFYTNGCQVANRLHQVMPNGDGLNPGVLHDQVCPWKGYLVPQGAMALPMPGDSTRFYLFHTGAFPDPNRKLLLTSFYYSIIDMKLDGELGDITSKNNVLLEADLGNFTAVRHGNGRDWWVLVPAHGNYQWYIFLVTPQGIQQMPPQVMSISSLGCEHHGQTAVSLDGGRIANWGDCKMTVFNFDRCSGTFSTFLEIPSHIHWFAGAGVAFSPSGRYLYTTDHNVLYRTDLNSASPALDTMRFSYGVGNYDIPGNTFHYLVNGPDGAIYGNISSRAKYFHAMENPDGLGIDDIDFKAKWVSLPVINVRTMPHFPNFKLFDLPGSPCDTLGIDDPMVATKSLAEKSEFRPFPNPAVNFIGFQIPEHVEGFSNLWIFDATGKKMDSFEIIVKGSELSLDIRRLPSGLYFFLIYKEGRTWSGRFIKV